MKNLKHFVMLGILAGTLSLTSCYSSNFVVGSGPQTGVEETGKNNFFIFGLAPGKHVDAQQMAQGKTDYRINIKQTFVDGLIGAITFGIYTPRTVTVTH